MAHSIAHARQLGPERDDSCPGERAGELGEDRQIGEQPDPIQATYAERQQCLFVLEPSKLALDGAGSRSLRQTRPGSMANWVGAWDEYRVDVDELTDLGDHALANTRHHGRGKSSGAEVEMQIFQLMTLRGETG